MTLTVFIIIVLVLATLIEPPGDPVFNKGPVKVEEGLILYQQ